jgi:hypothetical protein
LNTLRLQYFEETRARLISHREDEEREADRLRGRSDAEVEVAEHETNDQRARDRSQCDGAELQSTDEVAAAERQKERDDRVRAQHIEKRIHTLTSSATARTR